MLDHRQPAPRKSFSEGIVRNLIKIDFYELVLRTVKTDPTETIPAGIGEPARILISWHGLLQLIVATARPCYPAIVYQLIADLNDVLVSFKDKCLGNPHTIVRLPGQRYADFFRPRGQFVIQSGSLVLVCVIGC